VANQYALKLLCFAVCRTTVIKAAFKGRRKEGGEGNLHFKGYELYRLGFECLKHIMSTGLSIIRSKKEKHGLIKGLILLYKVQSQQHCKMS